MYVYRDEERKSVKPVMNTENVPTNERKYYLDMNSQLEMHERILHQIIAARDIPEIGVKKGDRGGWIERDDGFIGTRGNLSHSGLCWLFDKSCAYGYAYICENCTLHEEAEAFAFFVGKGNSAAYKYAELAGNGMMEGNVRVYDCGTIKGGRVLDDAVICEHGGVENGTVREFATIKGYATIDGEKSDVSGYSVVKDGRQLNIIRSSSYVGDDREWK